MKNSTLYALALSVFLGFSSLGYFLYTGIITVKSMERTVTVKGLAEKDFMANSVTWPIQFQTQGNTLKEIFDLNEKYKKVILNFLISSGVSQEEIIILQPSVEDRTRYYTSQDARPIYQYLSSNTITVKSENVNLIAELSLSIFELLKDSIPLEGSSYDGKINYSFNELNDVKPEMIEIATKNAREVAEKFAKDSLSHLGKIKTASQGQFSISTQDQYKPQIKTVRVVSTVEYYLVD